jgi:Zn-finger nucleic acid-binding protein
VDESRQVVVIRMELKYCEACGGLWLRREECDDIYCRRCAELMREIAVSRGGAHA